MADRVAMVVDHAHGEMVSVEIHTQQSLTGQIVDCGCWRAWNGPGRVEVPAFARRIMGDVVAHGLVGVDAVPPLLAAVVEGHQAVEEVPTSRSVGHVPHRLWQHDRHLPIGSDCDRVVPVRSARFSIGRQEQSLGVPLLAPLVLGPSSLFQVVPGLGQPTAADQHRTRVHRHTVEHQPDGLLHVQ
ncbi:hypothetical protein ACFQ1S_10125, partial [Kibdelosporangium lantanae]